EVRLRMQPACCISQQYLYTASLGGLASIKNDRSAFCPAMLRDHRKVMAFTPALQLFYGCSTKGIASSQHHLLALLLKLTGQFTDSGSFACTVDPHQEDDKRARTGRKS